MTIGDRIKNRRKKMGLNADQLANKLNVSRSTIFRYENGDIEKLPTNILEKLSTELQTSPAYLMGWEKEVEDKKDINITFNQLTPDRQKKVSNYANKLLDEQNEKIIRIDQIRKETSTPEWATDSDIVELIDTLDRNKHIAFGGENLTKGQLKREEKIISTIFWEDKEIERKENED